MQRLLPILLLILIPAIGACQNLNLFYLGSIKTDQSKKVGYVNLADENIWTSDKELIAREYYENKNEKGGDGHELSRVARATFLNSVHITEAENIYVYNMFLDSIFIYKVRETPLKARESSYGGIVVGFELKNINLGIMGNHYSNTFVYIGKTNPFQTGNVHPIVWEETDSTKFPSGTKSTNHETWMERTGRGKVFEFRADNLTYLIQNLVYQSGQMVSGRHLVVIDTLTDEMVFSYVYKEAESTDLSPLTGQTEGFQWTGEIFKDKPPMVFGFMWHSFGCPSIDFIGQEEPSIRIFCDNRH